MATPWTMNAPPPFLPTPGKPALIWEDWIRMFDNYIEAIGGFKFSDAITGIVTSASVIKFLEVLFSREGYPDEIVTDHGVQFVSHEFETFLLARNIKHSLSAIYHPQSNGLVERFNRSLKDALQTAKRDGATNIKKNIQEFLAIYRCTPQATTGISPSELLHGRKMRTGLDISELHDLSTAHDSQALFERIAQKQLKSKLYTDLKHSSKLLNLQIGDSVRVRKPNHVRKGDFQFTTPRKIVAKPNDSAYELDDGKVWNQERLTKARVTESPKENPDMNLKLNSKPNALRRSDRTVISVNKPNWHKDYL